MRCNIYNKRIYMNRDAKSSNWTMKNKHGDSESVQVFLTAKINEKPAVEEVARKMELALRLCQQTYVSQT